MKTLHVGGKYLLNRFSNLEAAVERADHDDVIELHKDIYNAAIYINKCITINGNGYAISPASGKTALNCAYFVALNNIRFKCAPRTTAVVVQDGGNFTDIETKIVGPARALYPTIVQKGGALTIKDSSIMHMETYKPHGGEKTITILKNCQLLNYYGGSAYIDDNDVTFSVFRGETSVILSDITCAVFEDECRMHAATLHNFNKVKGNTAIECCKLKVNSGDITRYSDEPKDGPLGHLKSNVIPYALHIAGAKVKVTDYSLDVESGCIGFYMTSGSLNIVSTDNHNSMARHLIKGGSVTFTDVTDDSLYELKNVHCGFVRSHVNTSNKTESAMEKLNSMIGLETVKKQLRTIVNTINVNMKYPEKDFGFSHHMIFAGDPGTGKTTVAKLAAEALFEIGAIRENKCMEVPANQMIKGFVGQTGEHVEAVMKKALGGVLFIDEAYELMVKDGQNTFNNDALSVLLRYMEDHRDDLIVIAAGYEKEMKEFLASNVGLTRRFQWISFEDYTVDEMVRIFMSMAGQYKESFDFENPSHNLSDCFCKLTKVYLSHPDAKGRITNGGNAGLVRNLFQQVIFARNNRVADCPESTMNITECDIQKGFLEELEKAEKICAG